MALDGKILDRKDVKERARIVLSFCSSEYLPACCPYVAPLIVLICSEMAIGRQRHVTQRNVELYENSFSGLKFSQSLFICSNDADEQSYLIGAERGCGRPKETLLHTIAGCPSD